jgi:hypothetical protein
LEIKGSGSTRKKLIDFVLDAIGASGGTGGLSLEETRETGKTREAIIKGKRGGRRAGQARWRGKGGITCAVEVSASEMGFSFLLIDRVGS